MSSLIYPASLPGLTYDNVRTPQFKTGVQTALSGKESRIAFQQYPRFRFELVYSWLDDSIAVSHLKALMGLFMAMKGRSDTFLYSDPTFNSVSAYQFGTGDGVTNQFQLTATYQNVGGPGAPELIQNLNGAPAITKAGVLQSTPSQYTLGPTGMVNFVGVPIAGAALAWSGSFYYRCRFVDDELSFSQFMRQWWETKTVALQTITL
jgi:uncharacterized protein (TIGR02217 family)